MRFERRRALKKVSGVQEVNVPGWQSRQAVITVDHNTSTAAMVAAVENRGYSASVKTRQPVEQVAEPVPHERRRKQDYDLMVMGAGSAGFAAAIKAVELGFRVAMVESGLIGGTCVNVGCVPSKTLIRAMEQLYQAGQPRFRGIHAAPGRLLWPQVIDYKDELVAEMRQGKYVDVLAAYPEITYIQGRARLSGENHVEIDGKTYTPGKILIATGSSPWAPPIQGLAGSGYLTSTSAMELKELPRSLIVLGGNAVGLELAQIFARAGSYVTLLELLPRLAPFEDEDLSQALAGYLEEEGMRLVTGFQTTRVEKREGRFILDGIENEKEMSFEAEQLLVAAGRRANTSGLGLEEAGVELGPQGEVLMDETLKTANPTINAAGDVTGWDLFVYTAAYGGSLAA